MADGGTQLLLILLAGLAGAIIWNLATWLWGLPSSSSHALFGGLIGSSIAGLGFTGVNWMGDGTKLDGVLDLIPSAKVSVVVYAGGTGTPISGVASTLLKIQSWLSYLY